jgi:hypothetical protein
MAARLNPKNQLSVREKIQATQLVNLLQNEALGTGAELSAGRRESAKYLISQAIGMPPQMSEVNFKGEMEVNEITDKAVTAEEWAAMANDYQNPPRPESDTH